MRHGNLVDRVTGMVGGGGSSEEARRGLPAASVEEGVDYDEIDSNRFTNTYGSNLTAGVWRDLAEFVADAQNAYNVGFGMQDYPERVGRWYMVLDDGAGNLVTGVARIKSRNSNDENVETEIRGVHTRRLNTVSDDYRRQFALEENRETNKVGEDSKIVLQFKLDGSSAGTSVDFTAAATVVAIPVSNYS